MSVCSLLFFLRLHVRARVRHPHRASVPFLLCGTPLVLRAISFGSGAFGEEREGELGAPRQGGARVTTGHTSPERSSAQRFVALTADTHVAQPTYDVVSQGAGIQRSAQTYESTPSYEREWVGAMCCAADP